MPADLFPKTAEVGRSESVAISACYSALSTTCWPRSLGKIGLVLAESHQRVGKADGVEGVSNSRCLRKLGSATRVLGEATDLREFSQDLPASG